MRADKTLLFMLIVAATAQLSAQEPGRRDYPDYPGKWTVRAGFMPMTMNTSVRLDAGNRLGTEIDLEDIFGLSDRPNRFWAQAGVHLGEKHQLAVSGTWISRAANKTITGQITWGDSVYDAGAELAVEQKSMHLYLEWRWTMLRTERVAFGPELSIGVIGLRASVAAAAAVGDKGIEGAGESSDLAVPYPMPGLYLGWETAEWLRTQASIRYIYVPIAGIRASNVEYYLGATAYPLSWLGVGAAISGQRSAIRAASENDLLKGKIKYSYGGLQLFAAVVW